MIIARTTTSAARNKHRRAVRWVGAHLNKQRDYYYTIRNLALGLRIADRRDRDLRIAGETRERDRERYSFLVSRGSLSN